MKIESSIRQIDAPQEAVYGMLSDLSNIDRARDRIPADKVKELSFDKDSISVSTQLGDVKLQVVEREAPKMVKLETTQSPLPLNFWVQVLPVTETTSKLKLTVKVDTNPLIGGMVKKPIQEGIERIADALQMIRYE